MPQTGPVPFLTLEVMLAQPREHPLHHPSVALPAVPGSQLSFFPPLQVSWYQVTCPPREIRAPSPSPKPPEKMSGMQVSAGQGWSRVTDLSISFQDGPRVEDERPPRPSLSPSQLKGSG